MTKVFNKLNQKSRRKEFRKEMTSAEGILWSRIRNRQLKYKFRRQHGIGNYIADFYCPELKLVIEIDGDSHYEEMAINHDKKRTAYFNDLGISVKRYTNLDIKNNLSSVLNELVEILGVDLTS